MHRDRLVSELDPFNIVHFEERIGLKLLLCINVFLMLLLGNARALTIICSLEIKTD